MNKTLIFIISAVVILGLAIFLGNKYLGQNKRQENVKGVSSYAKDDPAAPKIEISENSFAFGKIQPSDVAKHDFKIKNIGKNPLVISSLLTSCHCTTAILKVPGQTDTPIAGMHGVQPWTREITPDQEAVVGVIYEPSKMPVKGLVNRIIYLKTNDPSNTDPKLEITAEVQ